MAEKTTTFLLIVTTYRIHPDDVDAFKAISERMALNARQREGNRFLHVGQDIGDPAIFHLTEGWNDQQSLDEHIFGEDFQSVLAEAQKLQIKERSAAVYRADFKYAPGMPE